MSLHYKAMLYIFMHLQRSFHRASCFMAKLDLKQILQLELLTQACASIRRTLEVENESVYELSGMCL